MSAVALIRSTEVLIRSVVALIRSTEVLIRSVVSFHTWPLAFLRLFVFRNFLSYYWGMNFAPIKLRFAEAARYGTLFT